MGAEKTWMQRNHWYVKGLLILVTGAFALTRIPILVGLFIVTVLWMLGVVLFALRNAYWVSSRKRRYAKMTQPQRDEMQKQMIYAHEALANQQLELLSTTYISPENPAYQQVAKRRRTIGEAVEMYEQWRSELLGVPVRPFQEIRRYWVERDPEWLAHETAAEQALENSRIERKRKQEERSSRHGRPKL